MKVGWSIACTYVSWVPLRGCNMYKIPVGTSSLNYHQPRLLLLHQLYQSGGFGTLLKHTPYYPHDLHQPQQLVILRSR